MKCAAVVISISRGRSVRRSIVSVNHAYRLGSKKETTAVVRVVSVRYACVAATHVGVGCGSGVCADGVHPPPGTLSQRREPITIPFGPRRIVYESRSGAASFQS